MEIEVLLWCIEIRNIDCFKSLCLVIGIDVVDNVGLLLGVYK